MSNLLPPDLQAYVDEWERRDALPPAEKYPWLNALDSKPITEPIAVRYVKEAE